MNKRATSRQACIAASFALRGIELSFARTLGFAGIDNQVGNSRVAALPRGRNDPGKWDNQLRRDVAKMAELEAAIVGLSIEVVR